jgi:hypothetical protein
MLITEWKWDNARVNPWLKINETSEIYIDKNQEIVINSIERLYNV